MRAIDHRKRTMKSKIFKVFKLIFDLRTKTNEIDISKFNIISYDFILSMLLSIENKNEGESDWMTLD